MNAEQESIYYNRASQIVNILKGLAIWMVVFVHFSQTITINSYFSKLANTFQLGCQIFFALSAFTLCLSYDKNKLTYWQFFKKRVLKLFLAYYVMILFGVVLRVITAIRTDASIIDAINFKGVIVNALFLNGLVPNYTIHNTIVRGGWFIGTLFILYLLFPLLYKIFNIKNEKWQKSKNVLFPLAIGIISLTIIGAFFILTRNSFYANQFFIYTNFINQICAFSIGFVIFNLYKTQKIKQIKLPFLKAVICAVLAIILYIKVFLAQYVIVMFLVALATLYMFTFLFNNAFTKDNLDSELIMSFLAKTGKISLGIYYTHSYLVWEITKKIINIIFKFDSNPHIILKVFVAIVIFVACYWVGKLFNFLINLIQTPLNKKLKI